MSDSSIDLMLVQLPMASIITKDDYLEVPGNLRIAENHIRALVYGLKTIFILKADDSFSPKAVS